MKKKKTVQYFSDESLQRAKKMTPLQIAQFLEDFRNLHMGGKIKEESVLISIRLPRNLLDSLKSKAALEDIPYQRLIKKILKNGL